MTTESREQSIGKPSGNAAVKLHLSRDHYRPVISGGAMSHLGQTGHLRLVSIIIGAMRDECAECVSDTADAIALDAEATAVVHRIGATVSGSQFIAYDSPEADAMLIELMKLPFPIRRQMVTIGAVRIRDFLDGTTPPQAWV